MNFTLILSNFMSIEIAATADCPSVPVGCYVTTHYGCKLRCRSNR